SSRRRSNGCSNKGKVMDANDLRARRKRVSDCTVLSSSRKARAEFSAPSLKHKRNKPFRLTKACKRENAAPVDGSFAHHFRAKKSSRHPPNIPRSRWARHKAFSGKRKGAQAAFLSQIRIFPSQQECD